MLCSPLLRARETCALAGFESAAELSDDLREWDYGDYEGMTTPEIRVKRPGWWLWRDGCPGGERPAEVQGRAHRVLERFVAVVTAGGNVLAFAHGHILRVLIACWLELGVAGGARFALATGGVAVLGYERDTQVLRSLGR